MYYTSKRGRINTCMDVPVYHSHVCLLIMVLTMLKNALWYSWNEEILDHALSEPNVLLHQLLGLFIGLPSSCNLFSVIFRGTPLIYLNCLHATTLMLTCKAFLLWICSVSAFVMMSFDIETINGRLQEKSQGVHALLKLNFMFSSTKKFRTLLHTVL